MICKSKKRRKKKNSKKFWMENKQEFGKKIAKSIMPQAGFGLLGDFTFCHPPFPEDGSYSLKPHLYHEFKFLVVML